MKTIFLQNITTMDYTYVNHKGELIGMSANLHAEVSGEVDEHEQVVIDFSACKKMIKYVIDNTKEGIDHKLVIDFNSSINELKVTDTESYVDTGVVTVKGAYKCESGCNVVVTTGGLSNYLDNLLSKRLTEDTGIPIKVKVDISYEPTLPIHAKSHSMFSYSHALHNSSSFGCQGPHGHLSYIAVDVDNTEAQLALDDITNELNNCILINAGTMSVDSEVTPVGPGLYRVADGKFEYDSVRGEFSVSCTTQKTFYMLTDSTIENIIDVVVDTYGQRLRDVGATRIWVSEGLLKGAVRSL